MQVSKLHDYETLPRSVEKKSDCESASQCETAKCEPFPVFRLKKNAQCEFRSSVWKKTLSVISATQRENKNETLSVNSVTQCENKDKMLSVNSVP